LLVASIVGDIVGGLLGTAVGIPVDPLGGGGGGLGGAGGKGGAGITISSSMYMFSSRLLGAMQEE
jgi:hypothetical protein